MVDQYTKAVLTVIAACLVWNIVGGTRGLAPAAAQSGAMHVMIDSAQSFAFQFAGPLQVRQ
jgi:hypothetical protein